MNGEHGDWSSCYLYEKYFVTKQLLKYPNEVTHNEFLNLTASEGEEILEMKSNELNQH